MSRHPPRRGSPPDWSGRLLIALALVSFGSAFVGFREYLGPGTGWLEVTYQSFQLFFLNFNAVDGAAINSWLQMGRFGAFVTAVWAILKAFFPQVRQHIRRMLRFRGTSCAVILGYGPVGQAIGAALWQRDCGIRRITAVHPFVTPDLAARAHADGVLLVEGDPSDARLLAHVYVGKADRIYISDSDDLRAIDMAVAVRQYLPDSAKDIRILLNDSAVAAQIAEASAMGFLGVPGVRWYSVADETARLLIADARFDRFALESGAKRMHLVIIGVGNQGEAVALEALLTSWRIGLGPPKITFLDRNIIALKARMRRRIPAWFPELEDGALYEAARPDLEFIECDADTSDFARAACFSGLRAHVSGWVFAMGDDTLNLRASIALHRAIMARQIDPAPIYVRIPTGHVEDAPELSANPLGLVHTFGSIDSVIARSPFLARDPDAVPKILHAEYRKAEKEMFDRQTEPWENLAETKREANRALFRHAVMKIEDLGAVVVRGTEGVPCTYPGLDEMLRRVDESLAYDRIGKASDVRAWLKDGATLTEGEIETAVLIRDAAICEHNRWTTERALAQFVPTARPDRALRDDVRRLHNNMHDWYNLHDGETRRYDLVMLRVLLSQRIRGKHSLLHKRSRVRTVFLSLDGKAGTCEAYFAAPTVGGDFSELRLHLNARAVLAKAPDLMSEIMACLAPHIDRQRQLPPARIRFDFRRQPGERVLELANLVAERLRSELPDTTRIDGFWNWRASGSPVVGVIGHRDLTDFGGIASVEERLRQVFIDLVSHRGIEHMVTGYAPGTDRAAVSAWASLEMPKPTLVFPFDGNDETGNRRFFTDEIANATDDTTITETEANQLGRALLPRNGSGHRAQADELLEMANVLVFVVDGSKQAIEGGTVETLRSARKFNRELIILAPPT